MHWAYSFFTRYLNLLISISQKLDIIIHILTSKNRATTLEINTISNGEIKENIKSMQITDTQQVVATITPKNSAGNPAPVEAGSVLWTGPPSVALNPSDDGLSCTIVAIGIGAGDLSVSADADLGTGVVTISGSVPFEVVPSQAVSLGIGFGTPTEQVSAGPTPNPVV